MPTGSRVREPLFADSFVLVALLNPADAAHQAAVETIEAMDAPLVTTHWVLIEVADALCAPGYRTLVAEYLKDLAADPGTEVIPPDEDWYRRGLDLYARRRDKGWSLTDCISFVVMTDRGLTEALTGDHHFEQAGFRALLRSP